MIGLLVFNVEIWFGVGIVHLVLLLNQNFKYESKKQIGEDFTRDECVLNKLKINEQ